MTRTSVRSSKPLLYSALLFTLIVLGGLCWRDALPNNRSETGREYLVAASDGAKHFLPRTIHIYDDVVTLVVTNNAKNGGLWRTHLLPNRMGSPAVSFYDLGLHMCESLGGTNHVLQYRNRNGESVPMQSLSNDCIYIHYPPLAHWFFAAMSAFGFEQVLHFKLVAIFLNCATLVLIYLWLRREVRESAALIATVLAGTLPAFMRWADALFYQPFQYLFLIAGWLSWRAYLQRRRHVSFVCTWLLFLCEALVSHELTLSFATMVLGLPLIELSRREFRSQVPGLLIQLSAPVTAFAIHFGLSASLFGFARAAQNLALTLTHRVTQGQPEGFALLFRAYSEELIPIGLLAGGLIIVVVARRLLGAPLYRPLALLTLCLVGGITFIVAFPGTSTRHGWMVYRHLLPFAIMLMAELANTLLLGLHALRSQALQLKGTNRIARFGVATSVICGLGLLGWIGFRNAVCISEDIAWNLFKNRHHDASNLTRKSLDVLYWTEGKSNHEGLINIPVSGLRVSEPRRWITDLRLVGPAPSHYETWWLREEEFKTVRLLVDEVQVKQVKDHCFVSFFLNEDFQRMTANALVTTVPFVPAADEDIPAQPYSWVNFSLPSTVRSRAVRLTCAGFGRIALRQLEAFSL